MYRRFWKLFSRRGIAIPPPAALALLHAGLIAAGAGLLTLPVSANAPTGWSDAIFTATSAVTVTGLAVLDTGSHFTPFGQAVILVLIQLGGLGLMTFAALVMSSLGLQIGLSQRMFLREDLNQTSIADLLHLVAAILRVVVVCEAFGTALLAFVFVPEFGLGAGLWRALFHTVSAFNNAGFALFPDSLTRWAANPVVNLVVPALIIVGGIGFSVIADIQRTWSWRRCSLHTKFMLVGTAALLAWSFASFAVLEWNNPATLGRFGAVSDRVIASWFQAVTTRTAGFNTVDIAGLHDSTALMFMLLMLVGGGSTSTAGGIKVTTLIVLLLATIAFFKRRSSLHAFGRSLGPDEVMKVLALTMLSILGVMSGMFVIMTTHDGDFLDLAFEVVSAFGTVGLSRGATADLDGLGRIVIEALMFIGRVGPLTLGFFLATRVPPRVRYPASHVFLG
jgi:trk system potassium uptake protein TrkH